MDTEDKVTLTFFVVWAVGALISLGVTTALIYAAFHFISKLW